MDESRYGVGSAAADSCLPSQANTEAATDIGVTVDDGVVTLSGRVRFFPEKWEAVKAAQRVSGVRAMADDIEVILPIESKRTDSETALAAANALTWDTLVPDDRVKVTVKDGRVTMEGQVDWHYEKSVAENAVHNLTGVKGVTNNIIVKPRVTPADVKTKIETTLQRNTVLDAKNIRVEVKEGVVTLHGQVQSWAEMDEAYNAAWSAPNVTRVVNNLKVEY